MKFVIFILISLLLHIAVFSTYSTNRPSPSLNLSTKPGPRKLTVGIFKKAPPEVKPVVSTPTPVALPPKKAKPKPTPEVKPKPTREIKPKAPKKKKLPRPKPTPRPTQPPKKKVTKEKTKSQPKTPERNVASMRKPTVRQVSAAEYSSNPPPRYPMRARRRRYQGTVLLKVVVGTKGHVQSLSIEKSSGYEMLDQEALTTVKSWQFVPAQDNGATIPSTVRVPIRFSLNQ